MKTCPEDLTVGVVLAAFNGQAYIQDQINSILDQSRQPDQVVIVDDGSTDQTPQILEKLKSRHPNIEVYRNKTNCGWIENFEKGIALCTTDCIALSDQDDIWRRDKLEICVNAITRSDGGAGICYHNANLMYDDGTALPIDFSQANAKPFPLSSDEAKSFITDTQSPVPGFLMVFTRELKEIALPFPGKRFCAHDWWISALSFFLFDPVYIDEPLVSHRVHSGQTIGDVAGRLKHTPYKLRKRWFDLERISRNIKRELINLIQPNRRKKQRTLDDEIRNHEFASAFEKLINLLKTFPTPHSQNDRDKKIRQITDKLHSL